MAKIKICLDAGHYGKYNRSPAVKSYYESDMNWKLHLLLKAELENCGFDVITTRAAQDKDLGLSARGKKSKGCKLFLSLHSNACGTESVDRPEAIYLYDDNCGKIDEESKKIAGILGDVVAKVMQTNQKAQSYSRKSGNDRDGDGKKNDDYYGVLYGAHQVGVAGIILEHSYHTNTRSAKWLLDDSNLEKLAKAEAALLAEHFGVENEPAETEEYSLQQFVKDIQGAVGAAVDGIAGPETLSKTVTLSRYINRRHKAVKFVQKRLYALGYKEIGDADGIAGKMFKEAVMRYQKEVVGLSKPDGEITKRNKTWKKLLGLE